MPWPSRTSPRSLYSVWVTRTMYFSQQGRPDCQLWRVYGGAKGAKGSMENFTIFGSFLALPTCKRCGMSQVLRECKSRTQRTQTLYWDMLVALREVQWFLMSICQLANRFDFKDTPKCPSEHWTQIQCDFLISSSAVQAKSTNPSILQGTRWSQEELTKPTNAMLHGKVGN